MPLALPPLPRYHLPSPPLSPVSSSPFLFLRFHFPSPLFIFVRLQFYIISVFPVYCDIRPTELILYLVPVLFVTHSYCVKLGAGIEGC